MPVKIARSAPRPSFGQMLVAIHASRQSYSKAGKARIFVLVCESSGGSRFIGLKGKRNFLIVREKGSKKPADLVGGIYALLPDKVDIGPIERIVSGFMAAL
jgi:hypothetical protein